MFGDYASNFVLHWCKTLSQGICSVTAKHSPDQFLEFPSFDRLPQKAFVKSVHTRDIVKTSGFKRGVWNAGCHCRFLQNSKAIKTMHFGASFLGRAFIFETFLVEPPFISEEVFVSQERVSGFPETRADRGSLGNLPERLGNFRGNSELSWTSTLRELPGKSPGKFGEILGSPGTFQKLRVA